MECAISSYDRQCRQGSCHPPYDWSCRGRSFWRGRRAWHIGHGGSFVQRCVKRIHRLLILGCKKASREASEVNLQQGI
eukprot:scaffold64324_cov65-Attheya_sp.AAC.2